MATWAAEVGSSPLALAIAFSALAANKLETLLIELACPDVATALPAFVARLTVYLAASNELAIGVLVVR